MGTLTPGPFRPSAWEGEGSLRKSRVLYKHHGLAMSHPFLAGRGRGLGSFDHASALHSPQAFNPS